MDLLNVASSNTISRKYDTIDSFIWKFCVSYHPLNSITFTFESPTPHYTNSIQDLEDSCGFHSIITMDARSGCH